MKKILGILIAVMMVVTLTATMVSAEQDISVLLNGEAIAFDVQPQIVEGRTMVPLRAIFEALGATVEWDGATSTVSSTKGDISIKLTIGENKLYKNGEEKALDVPGMIVDSRTLVPVRAISEAYECEVEWEADTRTVLITTPVAEEVQPGTIINATADDGELHGLYCANTNQKIEIVEDPINAGNKVFMLTPLVEKDLWTYVWLDADFEAGKKYVVKYDALLSKDVKGNDVEKTSITGNFMYATEDAPSVSNHPCSGIMANMTEWKHFEKIVEIPANYVYQKGTKFGIYSDPLQTDVYGFRAGVTYYLDNLSITVATDEAVAEDTAKKEETAVDVSKLKTVYELKYDSADAFNIGNVNDLAADGKISGVSASKDPTITTKKNLGIDISKVTALKITYKIPKGAKSEIFFTTAADNKLAENKKFTVVSTTDDLSTVVVDTTKNSAWTGTLGLFRFDPVVAEGQAFEVVSVEFCTAE